MEGVAVTVVVTGITVAVVVLVGDDLTCDLLFSSVAISVVSDDDAFLGDFFPGCLGPSPFFFVAVSPSFCVIYRNCG